MVGGDFNAVINPALDKSQSDTTANPSSKLPNKFITELNLIDLWRIQNTKSKDFTFFSNRHKTFEKGLAADLHSQYLHSHTQSVYGFLREENA